MFAYHDRCYTLYVCSAFCRSIGLQQRSVQSSSIACCYKAGGQLKHYLKAFKTDGDDIFRGHKNVKSCLNNSSHLDTGSYQTVRGAYKPVGSGVFAGNILVLQKPRVAQMEEFDYSMCVSLYINLASKKHIFSFLGDFNISYCSGTHP